MSPVQAIAVVGIGVMGLMMIGTARVGRTALADRLTPYVGALSARTSGLLGVRPRGGGVLAAFLGPVLDDVGARLHRLLGSIDVDTRLAASGWTTNVSEFRAGQVVAGLVGVIAGLLFGALLVAGGRSVSPLVVLLTALTFGVIGVVGREWMLDRAVARRRAAMAAELPSVLDLICLTVTAGESLHGALDIVAGLGTGPLAGEMRAVLRATRAGDPLVDSLAATARRVALPAFDRLVDSVAAAQQRGVQLADSLHSLAGEVRSSQQRDLLEVAGRKQVSMLLPVVGLILPVAIVFAFYPGVVAIKVLAH